MLRVDVELDTPSHRRHAEVEVDRHAVAGADHGHLRVDRNVQRTERLVEHDLGVGILRRAADVAQAQPERGAPPTGRVTQAIADRRKFLGGDEPTINELLDHRAMIDLTEVGGEIEGEAGIRRDDDPIRPNDTIRLTNRGGLAVLDAVDGIEVHTVSDREVQPCRHRLAPQAGEHPGGRPGDETVRMEAAQQPASVLERR